MHLCRKITKSKMDKKMVQRPQKLWAFFMKRKECMRVTYINHSGFLLECEETYFLFDYYKGEIPKLNPGKQLVVFVSHKHPDHYNPEIFELIKNYPKVHFVLDKGVPAKWPMKEYEKQGIILAPHVTVIRKNMTIQLELDGNIIMQITTLKSTDVGVAYLIAYKDKKIYHAGDLNVWSWKEESAEYNKQMHIKYRREMEKIRDMDLDVAFVPLDPRQRKEAFHGMEIFMEMTNPRYVFPMHFWGKYSTIKKFVKKHPEYEDKIVLLEKNGYSVELS